jgi:hypothetical protein
MICYIQNIYNIATKPGAKGPQFKTYKKTEKHDLPFAQVSSQWAESRARAAGSHQPQDR